MPLINETGSAYYGGSNLGGYQFTSLKNVIDQFIIAYVGEDKIISKIKKTDVVFHAKRGLQELSFDTFKSTKAFEISVPTTLQMTLPQDYVNYVKLTWSDKAGIEHVIHPARVSSNPEKITQNADGTYAFSSNEIETSDSDTWANYQASSPSEQNMDDFDYDDDIVDYNLGQRYGLDPQFAQTNGSFYIDELKGKIHFSSNLSGVTIILKYISDSLGTEAETQVHKFAEEALYKYIAYAIVSTRANMPNRLIERLKKEARASKRQAKLRLSNIKIEEITQVLRGRSKQIKH
jgi:hypothetical protein|tara:strand:- start:10354 stop:11226 length:873 start_codon:yes stop_codon:yes gene_type:complete